MNYTCTSNKRRCRLVLPGVSVRVCVGVAHPADVVLALSGDGLVHHFLAADAQEHFLHLVQEFLQ